MTTADEGTKYVTELLKKTGDEFRAGASKEHAELAGVNPEKGCVHVEMIPGDESLDEKADAKVWTVAEITADPDGYFDANKDAFQKTDPTMTLEQIKNNWKYASNLFGYKPLKVT